MSKDATRQRVAADNRKARYNYEILDTFEAGIQLTGTEVKSLRGGKASILESYAGPQEQISISSTPTFRNISKPTAEIIRQNARGACCFIAARSTSSLHQCSAKVSRSFR